MEKMTKRLSMLALSLCLWTACSKKEPAPERQTAVRPSTAATSKPRAPALSRTTAPEPSELPSIDPALIPVEEDFRAEAEARIGKRTDLDAELNRIGRELNALPKSTQ